jgi:hypothetical protein
LTEQKFPKNKAPLDTGPYQRFFESLAERFGGAETKLSDVTYAMLNSNSEFLLEFAKFFGFSIHDNQPCEVEREYPLGNGFRVDLAIKQGQSEVYLIENKIFDGNYHFDDYGGSPVGKTAKGFGLIANHTVNETVPDRWTVTEPTIK